MELSSVFACLKGHSPVHSVCYHQAVFALSCTAWLKTRVSTLHKTAFSFLTHRWQEATCITRPASICKVSSHVLAVFDYHSMPQPSHVCHRSWWRHDGSGLHCTLYIVCVRNAQCLLYKVQLYNWHYLKPTQVCWRSHDDRSTLTQAYDHIHETW